MEITTRHTPSFGIARISLSPSESVRVEAGAMAHMAPDLLLAAKAEGGVLKSLKRAALGGESFFVSTYTAGAGGGWLDVAARLPGDIVQVDVSPALSWVISKGSWLASAAGVQLDTKWGGFKNLFGSEGGFVVRASGEGPVLLGCYGALDRWELGAGQAITVDTGHMVAYQDTVQMSLRKVAGGLVQSFKSGEGIVFDFVGPGLVFTQSRNPQELLSWIGSAVGTSNQSSGIAGINIGGLFGRD